MSERITRRDFLGSTGRTAAGVAAGLAIGPMAASVRAAGANEKIRMGLIGCGGMGGANLGDFMRSDDVEFIAICDVDQSHLDGFTKRIVEKHGRKPRTFADHRALLDMKEVDAVLVTTPDHWHAIPTINACAAGKDVYVEKPCSHNVREGRAMVNAARKHKRLVQVGTQQRSGRHFQEAVEYIRSGKLGRITMTHTWTYGNESPDGMGNGPDSDPPPGVDYDAWLGPAPKRPFNRRRFHGNFRWYLDYAGGNVGDWNVHLHDVIHWATGCVHPLSVFATGGKYVLKDDRDTPDTMQAVFEYPGFVQTFTSRKASGQPWNKGGHGMEFSGTNGTLYLTRHGWRVTPDLEQEQDEKSKPRCEAVYKWEKPGDGLGDYWDQHWPHIRNFIECVKSRKTPACDIEVNHQTAAACHLANIALRIGRKIHWDHEKELCFRDKEHTIPDAEANALLGREYRKGYELPSV